MIIVTVHLVSAVNGSVQELARMEVCNEGGTVNHGDYGVRTLRGRCTTALNKRITQRECKVLGHARLREHVWNLIAKSLHSMGYGK